MQTIEIQTCNFLSSFQIMISICLHIIFIYFVQYVCVCVCVIYSDLTGAFCVYLQIFAAETVLCVYICTCWNLCKMFFKRLHFVGLTIIYPNNAFFSSVIFFMSFAIFSMERILFYIQIILYSHYLLDYGRYVYIKKAPFWRFIKQKQKEINSMNCLKIKFTFKCM